MSSHPNGFLQKNQANFNFKQTKLVNHDENYVKINQFNKISNENESFSHREFGKVIPHASYENVNPMYNAQKILENKENIPKNVIVDTKNVIIKNSIYILIFFRCFQILN